MQTENLSPLAKHSNGLKETVKQLREKLENVVSLSTAKGMLFSGGLDTSILLSLKTDIKAINVSLESYGVDSQYAKIVVENLGVSDFYEKVVKVDDAIASIPTVIRVLKSFDPAIPNDLAVYSGLKFAKDMGLGEVMTGDGADELFAGYDFMNPARSGRHGVKNMGDVDRYIKRIAKSMYFTSNELGNFFNIRIQQPYLQKTFSDFALNIPLQFKIKEENGKTWGKWILRKAFDDSLPSEILWQNKRPLEYGSGMSKLRDIIASTISDEEFRQKSKSYPVKFFNKEHLYFYEIYRKEVGEIPQVKDNQKRCPGCGGGVKLDSFHCKVCGYVLETLVDKDRSRSYHPST